MSYESLLAENETMRKELEEMKKKLKEKPGKIAFFIKEYGFPFVIYWTGAYAVSGVGLYFAIENGWFAGTDAIDLMTTLGMDKFIDMEKINPKHGNIALAFLLNEVAETIRFPFVLATFPVFKRLVFADKAKVERVP